MATTKEISITVLTSSLQSRIRRNLAIIGKRAKTTSGTSLYSDITASAAEEPIYDDLLMFGAQSIASNLADICTVYTENNNDDTSVNAQVTMKFVSPRLDTSDSVVGILQGLVVDYLYNFVISRYLAAIHPSTGEKYPPLFAKTYSDACDMLIINIRSTAFLKRPKEQGTCNYGQVGMAEVTDTSGSVIAGTDYYTKEEIDAHFATLTTLDTYAKLSDLTPYAKTSSLTLTDNNYTTAEKNLVAKISTLQSSITSLQTSLNSLEARVTNLEDK